MAEPFSHILAPGRRDPALRLHTPEPEEDAPEIADPRHYRAFETGIKPARLVIHPRTGPSRSPGYATLLDIIIDRRFGSAFTLIYAHMVVEITGRNLVPAALAVCRHRATTLTEYDPEAFDTPGDGVPVIEGVNVEVGTA